jgi:Na+/melibiose symporter-like transporter
MISEETKLTLSVLEKQLSDRLEKLWRVFSWCGSILISITGGIILTLRSDKFKFFSQDYVIVLFVIGIVTAYAWLWIDENLKMETTIRNQMDEIFEKELKNPELKKFRPDKGKFGYKIVILLLGAVAFLATCMGLFEAK